MENIRTIHFSVFPFNKNHIYPISLGILSSQVFRFLLIIHRKGICNSKYSYLRQYTKKSKMQSSNETKNVVDKSIKMVRSLLLLKKMIFWLWFIFVATYVVQKLYLPRIVSKFSEIVRWKNYEWVDFQSFR